MPARHTNAIAMIFQRSKCSIADLSLYGSHGDQRDTRLTLIL
jgi:hypothetical protein